MNEPAHLTASLAPWAALFCGTAAAWFMYIRRKGGDGSRSISLRLLAMAGGAIAVRLALAGFDSCSALGLRIEWQELIGAQWSKSVTCSLLIGAIEEGAKMLPVLWILALGRFERPVEGLVLAACSGIGFATAESLVLLSDGQLTLWHGLARAATTPITHALFAAPWGLGLGALALRNKVWPLVIGIAASVCAHALYDGVLSRPNIPPVVAAGVVLMLWVWLIVRSEGRTAVQPFASASR